jgi:hypothetical protein
MTDDRPTAGRPDPDQPDPAVRPAGPPPPPGGFASDSPATGATTVVAPPPPQAPTPPGAADAPRRPGTVGLPVALGTGLLAAAVTLSTLRSRSDGDLDWSNYGVGLGATAALLLIAAASALLAEGRRREELVAWPGAVGVLGVGSMVGVGLQDVGALDDALAYIVGGVILVLSAVGYLVVRRGALVVTAILGFGLIYVQLFDDVFSDLGDEDDAVIIVAAAIAIFVLLVTAVGWLLRARAVSGVFAGALGVIAYNVLLIALVAVRAFQDAIAGMDMLGDDGERGRSGGRIGGEDLDNDVYVILAFAALLTVLWALAAAANGHPGFTVLAIVMPATVVPTATFVLAVEHPTWWGAGLAAAGAVLLAVGALLGRSRTDGSRRGRSATA